MRSHTYYLSALVMAMCAGLPACIANAATSDLRFSPSFDEQRTYSQGSSFASDFSNPAAFSAYDFEMREPTTGWYVTGYTEPGFPSGFGSSGPRNAAHGDPAFAIDSMGARLDGHARPSGRWPEAGHESGHDHWNAPGFDFWKYHPDGFYGRREWFVSSVPEPGTYVLMLTGLVLLASLSGSCRKPVEIA